MEKTSGKTQRKKLIQIGDGERLRDGRRRGRKWRLKWSSLISL